MQNNQKAERKHPNQQNQKLKGYITADFEEFQRLIRSHCENLHYTKFENVKEMDKFLDRYHILKLNQD